MQELAKYSFINAKLRAMLSSLLDQAAFDRLHEAKDIYECFELLKKMPDKDFLNIGDKTSLDLSSVEKDFLKHDLTLYKRIYRVIFSEHEKNFVFLLMSRYEIEQLKVALRLWHKKTVVEFDDYFLKEKICFDIDYKKIVMANDLEGILLLLDNTPYKKALYKVADKFKENNNSFYLEAALDIDYYKRILRLVNSFSSRDKTIARKILGVEIDIENIGWLIRLRKYYSLGIADMLEWVIPGGTKFNKDTVRNFYATDGLTKVVESVALGPYAEIKNLVDGNITLIDAFLYEILLREVKKALGGFPFTIGIVFGYFILKRRETRNIISVLYGKQFGWNKDTINPLLN